ncbi:unnamed protein product [Parajaminaea phylloscopi]
MEAREKSRGRSISGTDSIAAAASTVGCRDEAFGHAAGVKAPSSQHRSRRTTSTSSATSAHLERVNPAVEVRGTIDLSDPRPPRWQQELFRSFRAREPTSLEPEAACDRCRRRKIRCNRKRPVCDNCDRLSTTCSYADVLRKRGPPSKHEKATLAAHGFHFAAQKNRRRLEGRHKHRSHAASLNDALSDHDYHRAFTPSTPAHQVDEPAPPPPPSLYPSAELAPGQPSDPNRLLMSDEVSGAASAVSMIMSSNRHSLPQGGGHDQATAALLQTLPEPSHSNASSSRVLALDGTGRLFTTDLHSCPKTLDQVFQKYRNMLDITYFESIGVDITSGPSIRAACLRTVTHPACTHMSDYAAHFLSRAPTLLETELRATVERALSGGATVESLTTQQLAIHLIAACLASSSCLPLPLEDGRSHAVVLEFGYACFQLAAAVALPLYGADFGFTDPLHIVQVQSWLSTAALFSDQPVQLHLFWSQTAWMSIKKYNFHTYQTSLEGRFDAFGKARDAERRGEMIVRAVWGIVIVANFQHLLMPSLPPMTDEEITCSYPRPLDPPGVPLSRFTERHYSEEIFIAWSQYTEVHHLLQQLMWSPMMRKDFWEEVDDLWQHYLGDTALNDAYSNIKLEGGPGMHGDRTPRSQVGGAAGDSSHEMWKLAATRVLDDWSGRLDKINSHLTAIASDAAFFKSHNAQPLLSLGIPDLSGWVYVTQHALQIYMVVRDRVDKVASDLEALREVNEAMGVPLPAPSIDGGSDAFCSTVTSSSASSTVSFVSLGARSAPAAFFARQSRKLHAAQPRMLQSRGITAGHRDVEREPRDDQHQSRQRLQKRVVDWMSRVPSASGDEFARFVVGDLKTPG